MRLKKININNIRDTLLIVLFWLSIIYPQIEITHNITIDDGLAYSQVTCAYKDYRGIMWFGTSAGLSEWNSVKFKNYYRADGLPSTFISDICEDDSNHLYIATNKGLVYKKGRKFQYPIGLPQELHSEINKIFITRNGKFYILTEKTGVWEKRGNSFFYIKNKSSHQNIIPISITERESGEILIGTKRNGIYKISDGKLEQIIYQNIYSKYPIVDLLELNTDSLFVALQGLGIAIITQDNRDTFITTKNKLPSKYINNLFLNNSKEIYASTANGIAVITNGKVSKIINNKNGLHNEFVIDTFSPSRGTIFILTEGNGVFIYRPETFITYNKESGLLHNNIWVTKELHNGSLCFATDEGISLMHNGKFSSITKDNGLGDNLVLSIYEDENNALYLGTYSDGVNLIKNGFVKRLNNNVGMPSNSIWSILELDKKNILFVTHQDGIAVFDGKKVIDTLGIKNGLPSNKISSSFKMKNGTILIGVEESGVFKLANNKFTPFIKELDSSFIWAMYEDKIGNIYFGTNENGLIRYSENGKLDTINVNKGLSNNVVVSITSDNLGNIYVGTDKGLNIIKFSDGENYRIRKIYKQSGLASSECNQGAIYKDSKGNIWIGTIEGATKINSQKIDNTEATIPIYISKLKIVNKDFFPKPNSKNITLEHSKNDITFEYAGINYLAPKITTYRYKLFGIDKNWVLSNYNEIRYARLLPGKYTFEVSASNIWGNWSEPAKISFTILKPFWETWWFVTILFLIVVTLFYSIFNYRLKNVLRLERLRSSISADLHDEIGSGLSEISILSELLKFNLKNKDELEKGLEHIGETTRSLIERLSDIIWIVNPRKESMKNMVLRIQDNYQEVFYHSDISLNITNIEFLENIILPLEIKQNLYLIIKEAINNSLKYSECNNIDFEVNKRENKLCIEIRDDGKGFEEESSNKGNGLYNIKKRAEKIEAKITIDSTINKGTKIRVEVFLKKFRKIKI